MKNIAIFLFVVLLPFSVHAQTGIGPFGSYSSTPFDTINNENLNVYFTIPIVSSAGRGLPLTLSLNYNSQMWQPFSTWTPVVDSSGNPTWGWQKDFPAGGFIQFSSDTSDPVKCEPGGQFYTVTFYSGFSFTDVLGVGHGFPINYRQSQCPAQNGGTKTGYASDASGIYMDATNPNNPIVRTKNGNLPKNGTGPATDINGNFVTKTVNANETDWKDSVGNTALKILYLPSSTNPTSIQYEFLDGTGATNYQTITLTLTSTSIHTSFGCTGVGEYTGTANLPTELDIPSPSGAVLKYLFSYEVTAGNPNPVTYTGRLLKVTLPTGGSYEYDYTGPNDGINCPDGTTLGVNRLVTNLTTGSGTWNFVRNTGALTTTVTTPQLADTSSANDTVYTFNSSLQETSRKIYSNSPGSNLLRTINTTWATNATPATQVTILEDGSHTQSQTNTTFDQYGNLLSLGEYDWGAGAHGALIRTTNYTYLATSPYTTRNILNLVTEKQITDSAGVIQYRQDIAYDGSALTCPTGIAQHDDANYPCGTVYRGDPTSITTYQSPAVPSGGITKSFTYDWFGNLLTAQPNCCQAETWLYSGTTKFSQPDSVTTGTSPTQLTSSAMYNSYTGQMVTSTDENGQVTQFQYDFLRRTTEVIRPDSATITQSYSDTGFTSTVKTPIASGKSVQQITSLDSLGYPYLSTIEDDSSNVYSITQTKNDVLGRVYETSNPYTASPSNWTINSFDALGRLTTSTLPGGAATTFSYAANTLTVTDPAGKPRKSQTDAAGRLIAVWEPDSNNNLTAKTIYTYSVLDGLLTVTDGSPSTQTRTYLYDNLGRLTDRAEPETKNAGGQGHYGYQYNNYDLLTQRTDPRGVITTYGYDTLNRLHTISYNVGSTGVAATAGVTLTYGTTSTSNNNGRLITMADGLGSESYTYDILGRTTQLQKIIGSTTYTSSYQYNIGNELTQITYPSGRVVQQAVDPIGRLCAIAQTASSCTTGTSIYANNYIYNNPASQLQGYSYGNGVTAALTYSPDRLQLTSLAYAKGGTTLFSLTYGYGTALSNNGQITKITDNVDNGRTLTLTYDNLARVASAVTTGSAGYPAWGLQWAYDRYGNRTSQTIKSGCVAPMTCPTNSQTFANPGGAQTNRPDGYSFDKNGNMLNDGSNTIGYDAENRAITSSGGFGSGTYTYDGNNLRVKKVSGSTTTVYVYSGSRVNAEYVNGVAPTSPTREYIYSGNALLAKIESGATQYYHSDQLSARLMTDSTGAKIGEQAHYPFGEFWYLANTTTKWQFTDYERDAESGNDYAYARHYVNRLGRFASPDSIPGSSANPQSLNLFPYITNDPLNGVDLSGQCPNWHGKVFAPADLTPGDDVVKKVICTSASALNYRPDGGWSGTTDCIDGDVLCLAAGGRGQGAFASAIANQVCSQGTCVVPTSVSLDLSKGFGNSTAKDDKFAGDQSLVSRTFIYPPIIRFDNSGPAPVWTIWTPDDVTKPIKSTGTVLMSQLPQTRPGPTKDPKIKAPKPTAPQP